MKAVLPSFSQYSVLVCGSGSIGRRHLANLRKLGARKLSVADPDASRLKHVVDETGVQPYPDFQEALGAKPDVVFICTPPVFHIEQAMQALQSGAHVFVEKPLSDRIDGVDELASESVKRGRLVQVGYNLRFHPCIRTLKRLLDENVVGNILWGRVEVGQYLPDWRPWQDYRQSYTAQRALGGGIILDASHELDYVMWFLGSPIELTCMGGKVSRLEVDVEDCATILMRLSMGTQVDVHMDFVQPGYSRSCVLAGEKGKLLWDSADNRVHIMRSANQTETLEHDFEPNQMYVSEVEHFFLCIEKGTPSAIGLADARLTLEVALAARTSAEEKRWVRFDQPR